MNAKDLFDEAEKLGPRSGLGSPKDRSEWITMMSLASIARDTDSLSYVMRKMLKVLEDLEKKLPR